MAVHNQVNRRPKRVDVHVNNVEYGVQTRNQKHQAHCGSDRECVIQTPKCRTVVVQRDQDDEDTENCNYGILGIRSWCQTGRWEEKGGGVVGHAISESCGIIVRPPIRVNLLVNVVGGGEVGRSIS